jgi:hypothetical protein
MAATSHEDRTFGVSHLLYIPVKPAMDDGDQPADEPADDGDQELVAVRLQRFTEGSTINLGAIVGSTICSKLWPSRSTHGPMSDTWPVGRPNTQSRGGFSLVQKFLSTCSDS